MTRKHKIAFHTLGCKLNFAETSTIADNIQQLGYTIVAFNHFADIYVINTCYVTKKAEKKSKSAIRQASKKNPGATIIVTGCYSQLEPAEIAGLEGVNLIYGANNKLNIIEYLRNYHKPGKQFIETIGNKEYYPAFSTDSRTRAFLKIQDGCDYFCAYCTIPYARGGSRSGYIKNILADTEKIIESGIKEIVITGVNIGDFGKGHNENLYMLLKELIKLKGINRIRLSSIEPDLLENRIIELVNESEKLLPHFHIPLQSGCDDILKLMKRKYKRQLFKEKVFKIKSLMPDACIAADVIVGFPGESGEHFKDTCDFIRQLPLSYVHVFSFSLRDNTLAAKLPGHLPVPVKKERSVILHQISSEKKAHFYSGSWGKTYQVLFESSNNKGYLYGFTENYIRVKTPFNKNLVNQIVPVKLDKIDEEGVYETLLP